MCQYDFLTVEDMDAERARRLVAALADPNVGWLERPSAEQEQYMLRVEVGHDPTVRSARQLEVILAALKVAFSAGQTAQSPTEAHARGVADVLGARHPTRLLVDALRERLGVTAELADALAPLRTRTLDEEALANDVFRWMHSDGSRPSSELAGVAQELARLSVVFKTRLDLAPAGVKFISDHRELFSFGADGLSAWEFLRRAGLYATGRKRAGDDAERVDGVLASWSDGSFGEDIRTDLARLLNARPLDLKALLRETAAVPTPFDKIIQLEDAVSLVKRLGLDGVALSQLTVTSFDGLTAAKDLVWGAIRTKYPDEDKWREAVEPFEDELSGLKRDALVDVILSREDRFRFENTRQIYQIFFLDPEMDGCARTSRVLEAISTCQLYVQRSLMGLERSAVDDLVVSVDSKTARQEWQWMKAYRMWQANREVFLYPENYLLPDLRDDKSHIFEEVEDTLLQSEPNADVAIDICKNFLSALVDVSEFSTVCCLRVPNEVSSDSVPTRRSPGTYRFLGRSAASGKYYLRTLEDRIRWTNWEPVDLDIEAPSATLAMAQGKLHLFWVNVSSASEAGRSQEDLQDRQYFASIQYQKSQFDPELKQQAVDRMLGLDTPISIDISHSERLPTGSWSTANTHQFYEFHSTIAKDSTNEDVSAFQRLTRFSDRIYADNINTQRFDSELLPVNCQFRFIHSVFQYPPFKAGENKFFHNEDISTRVAYGLTKQGTLLTRNGEQYSFKSAATDRLELTNQPAYAPFIPTSGLILVKKMRRSTPRQEMYGLSRWVGAGNPLFFQPSPAHIDSHLILDEDNPVSPRVAVPDDFAHLEEIIVVPQTVQTDVFSIRESEVESILTLGEHQFLIYRTGQSGYPKITEDDPHFLERIAEANQLSFLGSIPLNTNFPRMLTHRLEQDGLDAVMSLTTQQTVDPGPWAEGAQFVWPGWVRAPSYLFYGPLGKFYSALGVYFWELYFHLPFMLGYQLNSAGRHREAHEWYGRVFDPTAAPDENEEPQHADAWRFLPFRSISARRVFDNLRNKQQLVAHRADPFNPFAVARLRKSAFQKFVVMQFIDNLLDWGDALFRRDTFESINEAMMLYVMAADILGEQPTEVGECEPPHPSQMTYRHIATQAASDEFLFELESTFSDLEVTLVDLRPYLEELLQGMSEARGGDAGSGRVDGLTSDTAGLSNATSRAILREPVLISGDVRPLRELRRSTGGSRFHPTSVLATAMPDGDADVTPDRMGFTSGPDIPEPDSFGPDGQPAQYDLVDDVPVPDGPLTSGHRLAFCVPPNDTLLGYWDRVEDRLYKIRHCMNLDGVVRELPFWQPRIDPALLVRARAAGIDLDDIDRLLHDSTPIHRFTVLAQRARDFTASVQQLGSQLLAALERKDEARLTLLRAVQETELLNCIREAKLEAIQEAEKMIDVARKSKQIAETKLHHFDNLLSEVPEGGTIPEADDIPLNKREVDALDARARARDRRDDASSHRRRSLRLQGSIGLSNQTVAGGGISFGTPGGSFYNLTTLSHGLDNVAKAMELKAFNREEEARKAEIEADLDALLASYKRRKEEWELSKKLALIEVAQANKQISQAEIRHAITKLDLETHDKQAEQARELYDFAKDRFTNLGLYTYLSSTLSRLHRQALTMAEEMARKAERAYRFETDDDNAFFIRPDNWETGRAGLLAGEKLLLQLQRMEVSYMERDQRRHEITMPCSLDQIDPDALLELRSRGTCTFQIPESYFDHTYPGQFARRIKTVRITIPAVVGPSTNVGARLTLLGSKLRKEATADPDGLIDAPRPKNNSIVSSTANADPGLFELRFDDGRYLPFEGAGAVDSQWRLDLPDTVRVFDYDTISDAILHISYTARDDGRLREQLEGAPGGGPGLLAQALEAEAAAAGFKRILSLRREFPSAFHQLINLSEGDTGSTAITLERRHFPFILRHKQIRLSMVSAILEPRSGETFGVESDFGTIRVGSSEASSWAPPFGQTDLPIAASLPLNNMMIGAEPVTLAIDWTGLSDDHRIGDVLLRFEFGFE